MSVVSHRNDVVIEVMDYSYFGASIRRKEDFRLLTGKATFVDDLRLPEVVHLAVLRSVYAHARILHIDTKEARRFRGALAVLTGKDLGRHNRPFPLHGSHPSLQAFISRPLASDKVRYVGEPVAIAAASTRAEAEDIVDAIEVDYAPLSPVVDPVDALGPETPKVHEEMQDNVAARLIQTRGNVERAFKEADSILRKRFRIQRGSGQSIEGRAIVADYEASSGTFTIWANTQAPHLHRRVLAGLFGYPEEKIRVIVPDVGGGFGPKGIFYPENFLVPYVAKILSRPVKWVEDRREHFLSSVHEREQVHDMEVALGKNGIFLAFRDRFVVDMGAYVPWGITVPAVTSSSLFGPYRIANFSVEGLVVYTNKVPVGQLRGAGRPQAVFVTERMVDIAARELGMDPAEIRLKNLIPADAFPYESGLTYRDGSPIIYDSGDYPECLTRALDAVAYKQFRDDQERERKEGGFIGIGIACFVEASGRGPLEGATVRAEKTGDVTVIASSPAQGQGHETTHAQICADELGMDLGSVSVVLGDTGRFSKGTGTFASRTAVVGGSAVSLAARAFKRKILDLAAKQLNENSGRLDLAAGRVFVKENSSRGLSLREILIGSPGLEVTEFFCPTVQTYTNAVHLAVVEVDPDTGFSKIRRYVVVHDSGRIINPMIVEGQIQGGVAHGIGDCLYEKLEYDEDGQLLTTSYLAYLIPTACEIPNVHTEHVEIPSKLNPIGTRGAGEVGTIGAIAAVSNAIEDALSPVGVQVSDFPITQNRVWEMILSARRNAGIKNQL